MYFKMKLLGPLVAFILLTFGGVFGQTDLGPEITVYKLKVVEDVSLERETTNFNYLQYLLTSFHPGFPKKCSLLRFEDVPVDVNQLTMQ